MSKIGKKPIQIKEGTEVEIEGQNIKVKGEKGELFLKVRPEIRLIKKEGKIFVERTSDSKMAKSLHGLYRTLISNLIEGVSQGFQKQLQIHGLGFRATLQGEGEEQKLILQVGFSHPIEIKAPEGISFSISKNIITVSGIDKELVGRVAALIRKVKLPEPYKGKGIRYIDEVVRRKPGKAVVKIKGAV